MAQIISRVQVLTVENEERTSKGGKEYQHFAARCVALDEKANPLNVCTIRSRQMAEGVSSGVKPGVYRIAFGGVIPDWGDNKGDLMPMVTLFQPEEAVKPAAPAKA